MEKGVSPDNETMNTARKTYLIIISNQSEFGSEIWEKFNLILVDKGLLLIATHVLMYLQSSVRNRMLGEDLWLDYFVVVVDVMMLSL